MIIADGDYRRAILDFGRRYPDMSYGGAFRGWLRSSDPKPYNGWGNGSAMRVSPVWVFRPGNPEGLIPAFGNLQSGFLP